MSRQNPNVAPKPFLLVPIPEKAPKRSKPPTHERFRGLTGKLELLFTVFSEYLFVGSGAFEFDPNHKKGRPDIWHTFYRRKGEIIIPATSIKGAIRAIVEAISNSCVSQYRRGQKVSEDHAPCREQQKLCPACRLFGTTGFGGRVSFSDALPQQEIKPEVVKIGKLWEPKNLSQERKFYQTKRVLSLSDQTPQPNFQFVEAVKRETRFVTVLHFQNLSEAELGLLAYALGWKIGKEGNFVKTFTPKLGGAKPRCFGAVKVDPIRLIMWKDGFFPTFGPKVFGEKETKDYLMQCMGRAREELLDEESWKKLADGLRPKENEFCPQEGY